MSVSGMSVIDDDLFGQSIDTSSLILIKNWFSEPVYSGPLSSIAIFRFKATSILTRLHWNVVITHSFLYLFFSSRSQIPIGHIVWFIAPIPAFSIGGSCFLCHVPNHNYIHIGPPMNSRLNLCQLAHCKRDQKYLFWFEFASMPHFLADMKYTENCEPIGRNDANQMNPKYDGFSFCVNCDKEHDLLIIEFYNAEMQFSVYSQRR